MQVNLSAFGVDLQIFHGTKHLSITNREIESVFLGTFLFTQEQNNLHQVPLVYLSVGGVYIEPHRIFWFSILKSPFFKIIYVENCIEFLKSIDFLILFIG